MFIGELKKVHEDERRIIYEANGPDFSLQQFLVKQQIPLGNHYHEKKSEIFLIQQGQGKLLTCQVNENSSSGSGERVVHLSEGMVVKISPYTAHTFYLEPGSRMSCFSSAPFNPDDMDMKQFILKP